MSNSVVVPQKGLIFHLILFLVSATCFSQLSNFTLNVGKTDESCTGNGSLTFSVTGLTPGASVSYSIYEHPDLTSAIITLPGNSYGGLSAGTYRVVANVSLNGESASQFADIQILNTMTQLQYELAGMPAICGDNGQITVNISQGTAVGYEIISGPATVPIQTSNVFTGLAAGLYEVRVFDACGEGIVQAHTLFAAQAGMNVIIKDPTASDCDTVVVGLNINDISTADIAYPLQIQCTIYPANGPPIVFNQTITSGSVSGVIYNEEVPFTTGELLSYVIIVTDSCGNHQEVSGTISANTINPTIALYNQTCTGSGIVVSNVTGLILNSAPDGYPDQLPANYTGLIIDNTVLFNSMPLGQYEFTATGLCGDTFPLNINVIPATGGVPGVNVFEGCDPDTGAIYIGGQFTQMMMVGAPAAFGQSMPYDVSQFIDGENGGFAMSGLPTGTYTFSSTDSCGNPFTKSGTIVGYFQNTVVDVIEHCGAFDLQIAHTSNSSGATTLWLQHLNPLTGQWTNPVNGAVYIDGTPPSSLNARQLTNNVINYNLAYCGTFRIMTKFPGFQQGVAMITNCFEVVYEFELICLPRIDQIYSFSCGSGNFDVIVEATGLAPLTYRVTSLNGNPLIIENGPDNVFSGLSSGSYNFQVEDACQNIVNRLYDISEPFTFAISGNAGCPGEQVDLFVPNFPFLNYQWYNANDPTEILSTTSNLSFAEFNVSDAGVYNVHIWHDDPLSCLDIILSQTLSATGIPSVGTGTEQQFCGAPPPFDLMTLLEPPFDQNGQWTTNAPGSISGNTWTPANIPAGTYNFTYSIDGECGAASATSTVTINPQPQTPMINGELQLCEGTDLQLEIGNAPNTVYHWIGPNGFTYTGSSLEIPNVNPAQAGNYAVTATIGSCVSEPVAVSVMISPNPMFTVEQLCDGSSAVLQAMAPTGMPGTGYEFHWTGPNGFSEIGNPVTITGETAGAYNLEVIGPDGCESNFPVEVLQTVCAIPLGVSPNNDGNNDNFDLTGLGVVNLKIFNRYGLTIYEAGIYKDEWHGQDYNGNLLPSATYYYLVTLNTGEARTGWVYLMR